MKKLSIFAGTVLAIFLIVPPLLPTSVGHAVYAKATDWEAKFYGLEQYQLDIGGMKIAYYSNLKENSENRPSIILLHGYSADKDVWPRFAKHFLEDYYVLIPDMAGHGDTGYHKDWSYSAPAQAKRMKLFLDKLGVQKAHVMGNSMGGFISAHFALSFPEKTLSATLIDPAGVQSPEPSDMQIQLSQGNNPFLIDNQEQFYDFFSMTMAKPPWLPNMILDAVAENYQTRKVELEKIFLDFHEKHMLDQALHIITPPVLVLWGGKDQLIHVSSVDNWKKLPNVQTHVWPEIGHMPMVEIPSESAQLVANFIADKND